MQGTNTTSTDLKIVADKGKEKDEAGTANEALQVEFSSLQEALEQYLEMLKQERPNDDFVNNIELFITEALNRLEQRIEAHARDSEFNLNELKIYRYLRKLQVNLEILFVLENNLLRHQANRGLFNDPYLNLKMHSLADDLAWLKALIMQALAQGFLPEFRNHTLFKQLEVRVKLLNLIEFEAMLAQCTNALDAFIDALRANPAGLKDHSLDPALAQVEESFSRVFALKRHQEQLHGPPLTATTEIAFLYNSVLKRSKLLKDDKIKIKDHCKAKDEEAAKAKGETEVAAKAEGETVIAVKAEDQTEVAAKAEGQTEVAAKAEGETEIAQPKADILRLFNQLLATDHFHYPYKEDQLWRRLIEQRAKARRQFQQLAEKSCFDASTLNTLRYKLAELEQQSYAHHPTAQRRAEWLDRHPEAEAALNEVFLYEHNINYFNAIFYAAGRDETNLTRDLNQNMALTSMRLKRLYIESLYKDLNYAVKKNKALDVAGHYSKLQLKATEGALQCICSTEKTQEQKLDYLKEYEANARKNPSKWEQFGKATMVFIGAAVGAVAGAIAGAVIGTAIAGAITGPAAVITAPVFALLGGSMAAIEGVTIGASAGATIAGGTAMAYTFFRSPTQLEEQRAEFIEHARDVTKIKVNTR